MLHLDALGGFHFNDRKYADDDLTLGSIDPTDIPYLLRILSADPKKTEGSRS